MPSSGLLEDSYSVLIYNKQINLKKKKKRKKGRKKEKKVERGGSCHGVSES
jgi:CelD/BcsL family acetyltransferase involved in cellulose biosynthesis